MKHARAGERFERTVARSAAAIAAFAAMVGDTNPLHHDAQVADGALMIGATGLILAREHA